MDLLLKLVLPGSWVFTLGLKRAGYTMIEPNFLSNIYPVVSVFRQGWSCISADYCHICTRWGILELQLQQFPRKTTGITGSDFL